MTELTEAEIERLTTAGNYCQDSECACGGGPLPLLDTVVAIIDARLAPIRALADEWENVHVEDEWDATYKFDAVPDQLRAALDAASAPVSAQQDHGGTEGQGEGCETCRGEVWCPICEDRREAEIENARGKELLCHTCGCTRWYCLTKFDGDCCGICDHPTSDPEETR